MNKLEKFKRACSLFKLVAIDFVDHRGQHLTDRPTRVKLEFSNGERFQFTIDEYMKLDCQFEIGDFARDIQ